MDVMLDCSALSLDELPLLPLLSKLLLETGAGDLDLVQLSRRIRAQTGGLYASWTVNPPVKAQGNLNDMEKPLLHLTLRGKSTEERIPDL
jgi:Zn-dependent M16 (insulinase) family peptidase